MKKVLLFFIFFSLLLSSLFSESLKYNDLSIGIDAIEDASYAIVSNFVSYNRVNFDSVYLRIPQDKSLPDVIIFDELDLSELNFNFKKESDVLFLGLPNPLYNVAKNRLERSNWKKGDVVITGASALAFNKGVTLTSLMTNAISGFYPKVALVFDLTFKGKAFSQKTRIEGVFLIDISQNGELNLTPVKVNLNGEKIDLENIL